MSAAQRWPDGTITASTALEFLMPQILDAGARLDGLRGLAHGRLSLAHVRSGLYVASWARLGDDEGHEVQGDGYNVGSALRVLLDELHRRIAEVSR